MLDTGCLLERSGNPDLPGVLDKRGILLILLIEAERADCAIVADGYDGRERLLF